MNLKRLAVSGMKWTGSATFISLVLQIGTIAILTRLLKPDEFGVMGMISVVIGFAVAFADMGISNAIIYKQDSTQDELSSLYWLNLGMGIALFILLLAAEPLVSAYFREPRLKTPYILCTFIFPILAAGQQFQAILQKNLEFGKLSKIQVISTLLGSVTSIILAFMGYGVTSLVFGQVILRGTNSILLIWSFRKSRFPSLRFNLDEIRDYLSFGLYQMGERAFNYLSSNVDYLIIGRFLGAELLGYYTLAYKIISIAVYRVNPIITRVAFPIFSKLQKDNEILRKGYARVVQLLSLVVFPFLIGAMVIGKPFVVAVFGEKWIPSILLIQIMALAGCLKTIINPSGSIILAKGRADIGFKWNLAATVVRVAVITWTCSLGLYAVAWAILIMQVIATTIMQAIVNKLIGMKYIEILKALEPASIAVSVMSAGILALKLLTGRAIPINMSNLSQLILFSIVGAILYLIIIIFRYGDVTTYYLNLMLPEKNN